MTSDCRLTYTWNAENRLVEVDSIAGVSPVLSATYKYDHQGRRILKTVNGVETKFLWLGNHIIQESTPTYTNSYCWSTDGQLINMTTQSSGLTPQVYFYCHDGNKNVTDLIDASGNVVAHYEFDPFGNQIVNQQLALGNAFNPFRFSNEYWDKETELVTYKYRPYNPSVGRWLCRDPIEEQGGIHLYGFVMNAPANILDYLGMSPCSDISFELQVNEPKSTWWNPLVVFAWETYRPWDGDPPLKRNMSMEYYIEFKKEDECRWVYVRATYNRGGTKSLYHPHNPKAMIYENGFGSASHKWGEGIVSDRFDKGDVRIVVKMEKCQGKGEKDAEVCYNKKFTVK